MCTAKRNAVKDFHNGKQVGRNKRNAVPARTYRMRRDALPELSGENRLKYRVNRLAPLVPAYYKSLTALRKTAPDA